MLTGSKIIIAICGSIAAYKAIDIIKELKAVGALVDVIMTKTSCNFISPICIETFLSKKVLTDIDCPPLAHIDLTNSADAFVIAPATANTINKYASGIADNLLLSSLLAFTDMGKVTIAPAMNCHMYEHPITQASIAKLKLHGVNFVGPAIGTLACGQQGIGRLADTTDIIDAIKASLSPKTFSGKKILVTAGATREYLDPVRFITNRSSGKMGYAIARQARILGADVTLVTAPTHLPLPIGINVVNVQTSGQMFQTVKNLIESIDIFIMSAAVADYTPMNYSELKLPKQDEYNLQLKKTDDILKYVGALPKRPFMVGFAAESGNFLDKAVEKLKDKKADMIVFNDITAAGAGFDLDTNKVTIIQRHKTLEISSTNYPVMSKEKVATTILNTVAKAMQL